jgi:hypothetical protein
MKKKFLIFFVVFTGFHLFGEKILTLSNLNAPKMLSVYEKRAFILQESTVFVFSLTEGKYLFKFCRSGEGPGEIPHRPFRAPMLFVTRDFVFLDGYSKCIKFTHNGELIEEKKKDYTNFVILPLKNRFVTLQRHMNNLKKSFFKVTLCSKNFKVIQELLTQPVPVRNRTIVLIPDTVNFWVTDEKIYVEKSREGLAFSVFDYSGKCMDTVNIHDQKSPVTQKDSNRAYDRICHDPEVKSMGGIEAIKRQFDFSIPEYFPSIREITADDQNIYLLTFKQKQDKTEFVIWNLSKKQEKRLYLPSTQDVLLDDELTGRVNRYYSFNKGFYYYLRDNEKEEVWELHKVNLE